MNILKMKRVRDSPLPAQKTSSFEGEEGNEKAGRENSQILPSLDSSPQIFNIQSGFPDGIPRQFTEESPLIVDNSILSDYQTCSTRGMIKYHHNLTQNTDSHSLLIGSATHKALEFYFKGGSAKEALNIFKKIYYEFGSALDPEDAFSWENTEATFSSWLAGHSLESLPLIPLPSTIEGPLITPLNPSLWGRRVLFLGLLDLIVRDKATNDLAIMDNKTTAKRLDQFWVNQFKTSSQLSGYIWLAQETKIHEKLEAKFPISSAYINTIQFSRLPASNRNCKVHSVAYSICRGLHAVARLDGPFTRTPLQISEWLDNARGMALRWAREREEYGKLEDLRKIPKNGMFLYEACKFCSFGDFCSGIIADPTRLPQFFRTKTWEPWNVEGGEIKE